MITVPSFNRTNINRSLPFILGVILCVAVFVRIVYLADLYRDPVQEFALRSPVYDQYRFFEFARELRASSWMGVEAGSFSAAYAYFAAFVFQMFGEDVSRLFICQFLLGVCGVFVLYKAASLVFDNKKIGIIAAFIGALYAPFVFYEGTMLRASLLTFAYLCGFCFLNAAINFNSLRPVFYSGIFMGLSFALRANPLPFFVFGYLALRRSPSWSLRLRQVLVFTLGAFIFVAPFLARNYFFRNRIDNWQHGYSIFWIGNSPNASGLTLHRSPERFKLTEESQGGVVDLASVFIGQVRKNPKVYFDLYLRKIIMLFNGYEIPANLSFDLQRERFPVLKWCFFDFTLVSQWALFGLLLLVLRPARRGPHRGPLFLFIFVISAYLVMFHIQSRYRLPLVPFMIIPASRGLYSFGKILTEKNLVKTSVSLISLFLIFQFTAPNVNIIRKYFLHRVPYQYYGNTGIAYFDKFISRKNGLNAEERRELLTRSKYFIAKAIENAPASERDSVSEYLMLEGYLSAELK